MIQYHCGGGDSVVLGMPPPPPPPGISIGPRLHIRLGVGGTLSSKSPACADGAALRMAPTRTPGGRSYSSVVIYSVGIRNPNTLGSIPWRGRVRGSLFPSLRVNSCLVQTCFSVVPDRPPPFCSASTARTQICEHVKHPIDICRKRVFVCLFHCLTSS